MNDIAKSSVPESTETRICFECDHRWEASILDDSERCPVDDCDGFGEPLG